jgi:hypothetical protein
MEGGSLAMSAVANTMIFGPIWLFYVHKCIFLLVYRFLWRAALRNQGPLAYPKPDFLKHVNICCRTPRVSKMMDDIIFCCKTERSYLLQSKLDPFLLSRVTVSRVARFFLIQYTKTWENIPNYHNITKWPCDIPNDRKIFQMAITCTIIFYSKAIQNLPQLEFLVWKQTIWQPWPRVAECILITKIFSHYKNALSYYVGTAQALPIKKS